MSPENGEYGQAVPSHDLDLFEDVAAPPVRTPIGSAAAPVTAPPPAEQVAPTALPSAFVVIDPDSEPFFESALNLAREPNAVEDPADSPDPVATPAPGVAGRLYRSSGATGPLAAVATVALARTHAAHPAPPIARGGASSLLAQGSVRLYAPSGEPAELSHPSSVVPAWLAPAALDDHSAEPSHAARPSARPSLLGRPTFSRSTSRPATRVGDGLLLATDGLTLVGELVLTLGAAVLGALIDVTLGSGLGLMLPLLWFVSAIAGAALIRPTERAMAVGVPPLTFAIAALVIGQLSLPAGHHLLTREALLIFNTLSSAFIWLLVTIIGCVAVVILRSRLSSTPEVTP